MDSQVLARLVAPVREISQSAGRGILEIASEQLETTAKADGSPLTRADLASNRIILAGLEQLSPRLPILTEEAEHGELEPAKWQTYWCVDPLDGTKEFIKGLDEYTVNIAIVERGRPVLGVIDVPALGVTYWAAQGLGAFKSVHNGEALSISPSSGERPRSAVVSRSHLTAETEQFLERLGITESVSHGSSLKICAVAEGKADVYPRFGPTFVWDTAAGTAIATEAGCQVLDLEGERLSYDISPELRRPGFVVCPTAMLQAVRDCW